MLIDKPKVFEVHKVEKRAKLLCVQFIKLALLVMENQIRSQNSKSKIRISLLKFEFPLSKIQIYILGNNILSCITVIFLNVHKDPKYGFLYKVENIEEDSLDSIPSPSPSVKIQIIGGKVLEL